MGFWDVLLFCIAAVLGPRWIAAAARNGQSSISLWILAAILFFVPTALVVVELSTRFPEEGGLYVWTKDAFGDFHGFVAGWTYWIYTVFYFPGLLLASTAMCAYVGARGTAWLAENRTFLLAGSFALLFVAVFLNIIGLQYRQVAAERRRRWHVSSPADDRRRGAAVVGSPGSVTHFTLGAMMPHWNWDTVNFWPQLAFAFAGLELVSVMSEEVKDPQRTFPRAIFASGALIALIYIVGTVAVLMMLPAAVDPKSGVFQAITRVRRHYGWQLSGDCGAAGHGGKRGWRGNDGSRYRADSVRRGHRPPPAGGVRENSSPVEDALCFDSRAGGHFGRHSAGPQINDNMRGAYQILVDAATILILFRSFICMPRQSSFTRPDRRENRSAVVIPGGRFGVCLPGWGFSLSRGNRAVVCTAGRYVQQIPV